MTENVHAGNENYDENFYRGQKEISYRSAAIMLPVVQRYVHPKSVADIGCGVGTWAAVWQELGVQAHGIDGDYVDRSQLLIDEKLFHPHNLEERITANFKLDLAETLEVAEHLSPERADSFVEDLTNLSDVILFNAAVPGQGGTNHVNEQWQSYWAKKFLSFGYVAVDCIRPNVWHEPQIAYYYRQNTFIYVRSTELYRYPELKKFYLEHRETAICDAIPPEMWLERMIVFQNFYNQVQAQTDAGVGGWIKTFSVGKGRRIFLFIQQSD